MPEIIMYMTDDDTPPLLDWLNQEPVVWIVCERRTGSTYRWKAVNEIDALPAGEFCLWHPETTSLSIPSGDPKVSPVIVLDPFSGWEQTLDSDRYQAPWLGVDHPGTFYLDFKAQGREAEGSLGRSSITWIGNYFSVIGRPATPIANKWWQRLRRFIKKQSIGIPWPPDHSKGRVGAYAFPHAFTQFQSGRVLDANP